MDTTFAKLPELKSASEFTLAITAIENDIAAEERNFAEIGAAMEKALFENQQAYPELRRRSVDSQTRLDDLRFALQGARTRKEAAESAEHQEDISATVAELVGLEARVAALSASALEKSIALRADLAERDKLEQVIEKRNSFLQSAGKQELTVNVRKVRRVAYGPDTPPLNKGLSRDGAAINSYLRDLLSPVRVEVPSHRSHSRIAFPGAIVPERTS